MKNLLFNYRKFMGYYLLVSIPGDMVTDPQSIKIKEHIDSALKMWPKVFVDHASEVSITYP